MILAGLLAIAASILFVGRYQISAIGYGYGYANGGAEQDRNPRDVEEMAVYRLDRWTGMIDYCRAAGVTPDGAEKIDCPFKLATPSPQPPQTGQEFFGNKAP